METLRHIPGSVWRGAVAAQWIEEHGLRAPDRRPEDDEQFKTLFLRGLVRFGDLRLKAAKVTKPWPFSARGCKLHDNHPIHDLLIPTARREPKLPIECGGVTRLPCGAKLDRPDGFLCLSGKAEKISAGVRVLAHSAISNSLLRVRQEQFFSQEVLQSGQTFEGELLVDPADQEAQKLVTDMCGTRIIPIGRGSTRGMGLAEMTISHKDPPADPVREIRGRLDDFRRAYKVPGHVVFTATLHSPCVVYDEWLFSRPVLRVNDIDLELGDYCVWASYSRTVRISGWNAQAQLPKPDIEAIAPGSCFLFGRKLTPGEAPAEMDRLAAILARHAAGLPRSRATG